MMVHPEITAQQHMYVSLLQLQREVSDLRRDFNTNNTDPTNLLHRLQESEVTVAALRAAVIRITLSTTAIDQLTRGLATASDSGTKDKQQPHTELEELRRWRQVSTEQTRHLVARNNELTQQNAVVNGELSGVDEV